MHCLEQAPSIAVEMLPEGFDPHLYVRMMDDLKRSSDDNPTVGIIFCADKDASVVHYSILNENEQLFASKYKLVFLSEEELRSELDREHSELAS